MVNIETFWHVFTQRPDIAEILLYLDALHWFYAEKMTVKLLLMLPFCRNKVVDALNLDISPNLARVGDVYVESKASIHPNV